MDTAIVLGIIILAAAYLLKKYLVPSKSTGCGCSGGCSGCGEQPACTDIADAPPSQEPKQ